VELGFEKISVLVREYNRKRPRKAKEHDHRKTKTKIVSLEKLTPRVHKLTLTHHMLKRELALS
jgi:hypothetical protein